jgi:hypothetical protein
MFVMLLYVWVDTCGAGIRELRIIQGFVKNMFGFGFLLLILVSEPKN